MRNLNNLSLLTAVVLSAVGATRAAGAPRNSLTVTSSAFDMNESIPVDYTCDGADRIPPLSWSNVPADTKSIAILVDDPDAPKGTFVHWMVTNIPASETSLSAGGALPEGALTAKNGNGATGYTGPCPPSGTHHYHFQVYALDKMLPRPASRAAFMKAIKGHILAQGELVGVYQRTAAKSTMKR